MNTLSIGEWYGVILSAAGLGFVAGCAVGIGIALWVIWSLGV